MNSSVFNNLCERWEDDYIANKNMLAFGDCDFDYDDYADLIKQSYNYLNEIVKSYNLSPNDLHNSNPTFMFDYVKLV